MEINLLPYETPGALEEVLRSFAEYYNYQRYHEALGSVTFRLMSISGGTLRCYSAEKKLRAGQERPGRIIIEPLGSRALDSKVSIISRAKMSHFR